MESYKSHDMITCFRRQRQKNNVSANSGSYSPITYARPGGATLELPNWQKIRYFQISLRDQYCWALRPVYILVSQALRSRNLIVGRMSEKAIKIKPKVQVELLKI
jgi:hypothetical protein